MAKINNKLLFQRQSWNASYMKKESKRIFGSLWLNAMAYNVFLTFANLLLWPYVYKVRACSLWMTEVIDLSIKPLAFKSSDTRINIEPQPINRTLDWKRSKNTFHILSLVIHKSLQIRSKQLNLKHKAILKLPNKQKEKAYTEKLKSKLINKTKKFWT